MKRFMRLALVLLPIGVIIGCDDQITNQDLQRQQKQIESAKEQVKTEEEQLAAMKERQDVQATMETELAVIDASIKKLEELSEKATADQQIEISKEIAGLRTRYQQLQKELDELKAASGDFWASAKLSAEKTMKDLKKSVDEAVEKWNK